MVPKKALHTNQGMAMEQEAQLFVIVYKPTGIISSIKVRLLNDQTIALLLLSLHFFSAVLTT